MTIKFDIIKLSDHHNRGQFIIARQLNFKEPIPIKEGALLHGIPVYHYLGMYPFGEEQGAPEFDVYVFRPTDLQGYPKGFFREGQIVELVTSD